MKIERNTHGMSDLYPIIELTLEYDTVQQGRCKIHTAF